MVLIDTCVLYWLASNRAKLSQHADDVLRGHANSLYISAISAFEVALNHRKRRVVLPTDPNVWFASALLQYHITCLPVTWQVAVASVELPPIHADPADRIIIATSVLNSLPIVTPDAHIQRYSGVTVVW